MLLHRVCFRTDSSRLLSSVHRSSSALHSLSTSLRGASSSGGGGGFRAGATKPIPFAVKAGSGSSKSALLSWQPSPRLMKNGIVRYLFENIVAIATYQLVLEVGLTAVLGLMIYRGVCTGQDIVDKIQSWHYPFMSWIALDDCTYKEGINVGPRTLQPEKLTAAHTAHNIASGLLPLQVVFMICTYPFLIKGYRAVTLAWSGSKTVAPVAETLAAGATGPAAAAGARARASSGAEAGNASKPGPKQPVRRPAYVRASTARR